MPSLKMEVEEAVLQRATKFDSRTVRSGKPLVWGRQGSFRRGLLLLLVSLAAISVNGYHPYSEDAGIYVAGIKQAAHQGIYGSSSAFIAPYIHMSVFFEWNAWVVRALRVPIEGLLFAGHVLTTWLLLYACWRLTTQCFESPEERWAAVLLVASCLSVPAAGTSLFLMDPYLTSRSFSTPLTLLALSTCLDEKLMRTASLLLLVGLFHPLMAVYATCFSLLVWAVKRDLWKVAAGFVAAVVGAAAVLQYSQRSVVESAAYRAAVFSRSYFFLYRWHWYEVVGAVAPLALLAVYSIWRGRESVGQSNVLTKTCIVLGIVLLVISLLFARPSNHSHLICALQPLRPFLWIYFCMFLLLGGTLGRYWLRRVPWRWGLFFVGLASGLTFLQHRAYASSAQVELPWISSTNGWKRAFLWIKANTPADAVVALDADYIHAPGEDAQGFRAIAERNSLADFSKDGGAAAVFPQLADRWMSEQTATTGLNRISDSERRRRLVPYHVGWIVLEESAKTAMPCPFENELVKVCRLQ